MMPTRFAHRLGYAIPATTVLGAILLTGYMGGTVAAHVRVYDPFFTHIMSGVYGALLVWGGLYARDPRLRALVPLVQTEPPVHR